MRERVLFTSESVSEGHPDKICDQISDAILDACLAQDKNARVACECFITTNYLVIGGEITTSAHVNYEQIARNVLHEIGYNNESWGIDYNTCRIEILINTQSPDIALGVNQKGAGDQGIMFGYATIESKNYMPLGSALAHDLVRLASQLRKNHQFQSSRPDMKSQVTMDLTDPENPKIDTMLMSIQHDPEYNESKFCNFIKNNIMLKVAALHNLNLDFKVLINPTGRFVVGGPKGDTGLTGRKIIVDTYGGYARHGGGAFSGKDATKVDRSAAYMCRYVAKNIVAAGLAQRCEIQVSYAIGVAEPISIYVNTFQTHVPQYDDLWITKIIRKHFDFRPQSIIDHLSLTEPIYQKTSVYGHFGRDQNDLPWERLDKVMTLMNYLKEV